MNYALDLSILDIKEYTKTILVEGSKIQINSTTDISRSQTVITSVKLY
jgi:hypothetical protein